MPKETQNRYENNDDISTINKISNDNTLLEKAKLFLINLLNGLMNEKSKLKDKFIFNWVLRNKLAIGTSPMNIKDVILLKKIILKIFYAYGMKRSQNGI